MQPYAKLNIRDVFIRHPSEVAASELTAIYPEARKNNNGGPSRPSSTVNAGSSRFCTPSRDRGIQKHSEWMPRLVR
ncbi:hypothetical protein CSAL01_01658 [Colletotrichum salicis]|uniref:Uncharacterized protein n=1 Tax=Colletotrichum salicis TaxID=1209931 RepID=A0A135S125_9PEZI|nr:hypothetical protein CSAL01_01658 [Colletotrichum salicis]